jgi:hypothetical protein
MMDSRVELIDSIIAHMFVCIVCIDVCCHEAGMGHAHIKGVLEMLQYERENDVSNVLCIGSEHFAVGFAKGISHVGICL